MNQLRSKVVLNHPLSWPFSLRALRVIYTFSSGYSLLSASTPAAAAELWSIHHTSWASIFPAISSETFLLLYKQQSFADLYLLEMEVPPQRDQPLFFCLLPISLIYTFTQHKQKTAPRLSHWSGNGSRRSDFLDQTAPRHDGGAQCHSTLHRVSMKWQSRQDSLLRPALAPTLTPYWLCRRGMLSVSWNERGSRGLQETMAGAEGQGNRETHPLA